MSITFTSDELNLLKELSKGNPELSDKLSNIHAGIHYQSYMESIEDDVSAVIENGEYGEISDSDLERIVSRVANYDSGDYHDFIDVTIGTVIAEEQPVIISGEVSSGKEVLMRHVAGYIPLETL